MEGSAAASPAPLRRRIAGWFGAETHPMGSSPPLEVGSAPRARFAALAELIHADGLALAPGDRLRFYAVTRSILPEDHRHALGEELLYEVESPLPSGGS